MSMQILVLNPFGATEPFAAENLGRVARPDTKVNVENIKDVFPLNYNTYIYNITKCANAAAERIIKAEQEGYDGVMISCMADPGLWEARCVVDIPVLGTMETTLPIAMLMGRKFSLIATDRIWAPQAEALITKYGLWSRCASVRDIGITACDLYPDVTPTEELEKRTIEVARKCVEDDQAEVLIPGCTILGAILTKASKERLTGSLVGVPVIDPMVVTLKVMEAMVDLTKKVGYPAVSRVGMYKKPPREEFIEMRRWLSEHKSPEQLYHSELAKAEPLLKRKKLRNFTV